MTSRRHADKTWFHVDMDAFFAAVEQRDNPDLKGKPVIIGALPGNRGVVAACSYEARKFGVHSAMPISKAYQLCPGGTYLRPRSGRYQEMSRQIMQIFRTFTPTVLQISVDEAFLDMTGTARLFGPPAEAAEKLKKEILNATGLTVSIGIAPSRYLAKLSSEVNKPDGMYQVHPGEEESFISTLSLKDLWGVGKKSLERFRELNITSIEQMRGFPKESLIRLFGSASGEFLYKIVRGIDPGIYQNEVKSKTISHETTFAEDTRDEEVIRHTLLNLSHEVMNRVMLEQERSHKVFIKVRFKDFTTTTAQMNQESTILSAEEIFHQAQKLLEKRWDHRTPIRLIGVGVGNMEKKDAPIQGDLFEKDYHKKRKVEEAIFKIRQKGTKVTKASLLKDDGTSRE